MNNSYYWSFAILAILAFGTVGFSRLLLRRERKLTENDLIKIDLKYKGLYKKYFVLYDSWFAVLFLSAAFIVIFIPRSKAFPLLIPVAVSIAVIDGIFSLATDVIPASGNHILDRFVYNKYRKFHWIAIMDIIFGVAIMLGTLFAFYL
jgi:hypothetical protein